MKSKKFISLLLSASIFLTMMPANIFAANENTTSNTGGELVVDKTSKLEDDGTYSINLEAFATGEYELKTIEKPVPLDIVLVMDQSGSLIDKNILDDLKTAATNFTMAVYKDGEKKGVNHRVAVVGFASGAYEQGGTAGDIMNGKTSDGWVNTGIFLRNGTFKNFMGYEKGFPGYKVFNGKINPEQNYYVYINNEYVPLTYIKGEYSRYTEYPENKKSEVYGFVDGNYIRAQYKDEVSAAQPGWYCNGNLINEYYKLDKTKSRWVYTENGITKEYRNSQTIYVKNYGITDDEYRDALMNVSVNPNGQGKMQTAITNAINKLGSGGSTRTGTGIEMGNQIFANNPIDRTKEEDKYRQRIMIVFSDGRPEWRKGFDCAEARTAVNEAYKTKHTYDAKVYTVGFEGGVDAKGKELLEHVSSNYPNSRYQLGKPVGRQNVSKTKNYAIKYKEHYYGVYDIVYDRGWYRGVAAFSRNGESVKGQKVWAQNPTQKEQYRSRNDDFLCHYYPVIKEPGTPAGVQKYAVTGSQISNLYDGLFIKIKEENSSVSYPVYLNEQALMRDIITENFRVTDKTSIEVFYIPGEAKLQNPTDKVTDDNIKWNKNDLKPQLTLNVKDCENVNGVRYKEAIGPDGVKVKIELYEHKQGNNNSNMDVIDVSGFNYAGKYIGYNHPGEKIQVKIKGLEAKSTVNANEIVLTNHPDSGIWPPKGTDTGTGKPEQLFPQPEVTNSVSEATFVQDYAKDMNIPIETLKLGNVKHIQAINEENPDYKNFDKPVTVVNNKYGKLTSTVTKLTYSPKTMSWDGYDSFYAFGDHMSNPDQNVWAKINILPANNVYYEDTFVSNKAEGKVGIEYSGNWDLCTSGDNITLPEQNSNQDTHGWVPALNGENNDTDGTSHHGFVENRPGSMATATFTFVGNAVDIYSRTTPATGTILASLASSDGKIFCSQLVDTISASGEYYQVPTLSFTEQNNGEPLPYGKYTVSIYVTAAAEGRYNYYLDGIRVYCPMNKNDIVINDAYGNGELNAVFKEIRQELIDKRSFGLTRSSVGVFIDRLKDADGNPTTEGDTSAVVGEVEPGSFEELGPKNEVYLKPGQQISFNVDTTMNNSYQVGMKALNGQTVNVAYSNNESAPKVTFRHPGDMYYKVEPDAGGMISIMNMNDSEGILSITKLKVTNADKNVKTADIFTEMNNQKIMEGARTFRTMAMAPPKTETDTEPSEENNNQNKDMLNPENIYENTEEIQPLPGVSDFETDNQKADTAVGITKNNTDNILCIISKIFDGFHKWFK